MLKLTLRTDDVRANWRTWLGLGLGVRVRRWRKWRRRNRDAPSPWWHYLICGQNVNAAAKFLYHYPRRKGY
jgi:hypothetical protein